MLNKESLHGRDIVDSAAKLGKMNMVILGDGHSNIECKNSVENPIYEEYSKVITNIPFNLNPFEQQIADMYGSSDCDANCICIRHCLYAIKPSGEAAIVMPETIAYSERYNELREWIIENSDIRAIIRLPRGVFKSYTTARTFVLLLKSVWTKKTKKFPFIDIAKDGFSEDMRRQPIQENDIPELLENMDNLAGHYPQIIVSSPYFRFFRQDSANDAESENTWPLGDLLEVVREKKDLDPHKTYYEPRLNSSTNTVSPRGAGRIGSNISGKKVLTEPGDLIIGKLHTQSGNGLFAFCDREYVTTSQIVAKVKEDLVPPSYLKHALRKVLPNMSKDDLVGRETYTEQEILSVRITKPTKRLADAFIDAEKRREEIDEDLLKIIEEEEGKHT